MRTRDLLANVRTFLSFQRAAVVLLVLGLAVDRIGLFVRSRGGAPLPVSRAEERVTALLVAGAGLVLVAGSYLRFRLQRAAIEGTEQRSRVLLDLGLLAVVAAVGALLVVHLGRIGA